MESSRRAVEAYRRTRLIDGVTTDDDQVAPVYKLDEISSVLRSSPYDVVHEMVEYVFKRLEHKSPYVKQKALRFIKFTVGKSGSEFKREIQRQSPAIKLLLHYQGQPDPLRGDSLNKAVRETAKEAIAAIFASEDRSETTEGTRRRIEGFGSTNFDARPVQEKKTLLSEVVDIGAASIKQGLSILSNHYGHYSGNTNGVSKNFGGSYEAPNLRRTMSERESYRDSYQESRDSYKDTYRGSYVESRASYETKVSLPEPTSPGSPKAADEKSDGDQEEKLLDALTTVGGVRLQPSREAVQSFLIAAQKLNPEKLFHAFERKLQAHSWQVRFKALCLLEATIRQRSLKAFGDISLLFTEDSSCIVDCSESPQNTLRDKAKKVLEMLQGKEGPEVRQTKKPAPVEMPDLMDTNPSKESNGSTGLEEVFLNPSEDLLGTGVEAESSQADNVPDDPFAGLSIHNSTATDSTATTTTDSLLDMFSEGPEATSGLFEGLSVTKEARKQPEDSGLDWQKATGESGPSKQASKPNPWQELEKSWQQPAAASTVFPATQPQVMYINPYVIPAGALQSGVFLHQAFPQGGMNPQPMGQQQQQQQHHHMGSFGSSGRLDAFDFSSSPYAPASGGVPKMEEKTKAFDFISDHVAAARTVKK